MRQKTISLIYVNAGGGHRASARALEAEIERQQRPWQVQPVNLFEVLDPKQAFRRYAGFNPEDFYNQRLARGWTLGMAQELRLLQAMIRLGHAPLLRALQQHWLAAEPDCVLSLVPNFNRVMCESLASSLPGVPFATLLTDLADHPPHFWIEPDLAAHWICGSRRAVGQARAMGYGDDTVHPTSGMVIHPDFYAPPVGDRSERLRALGLDPSRPTGLVLFGGQGSRAMISIARELHDTQLILACGHNQALAAKLRALPASAPRHVLGYTNQVAATMQLADFFIGKAGPGSISEAVQMGLPVIVTRNAWTLPQERYNTRWVEEQGVGSVLKGFAHIRQAVAALIADLDAAKQRVRQVRNRAVFEVPEILERILAGADRGVGWQPPRDGLHVSPVTRSPSPGHIGWR